VTAKETELEELRVWEARSRIVMETVADAIITIDEESTILYANRATEKIFGHATAELQGAKLTMLMPDYMRRLHEVGIGRYLETNTKHISWEGVELPGLHRDGREIALEVSFGEFALGGRRYFTGIARDITERKRAERRLAAQYEVTRILSETPDLKDAAPHILKAVCEGLSWEMGALWVVDDDAQETHCVETWHAETVEKSAVEAMTLRRVFAKGEGLPGRVWAAARPMWVEDIVTQGNFPRAAVAEAGGLHGAFAFPIMLRGETLGVMEFFSREVRPPELELLAMMAHIGSQIGQLVERRRAEEERALLQSQIIRLQQEQLAELSTPLIPLTEQIVVMPLIGSIDAERAHRMMHTLLAGLAENRAPVAIIDITGVPVVDTHVANALIQLAQAAHLLGTEVVLTGIRAGVARSLTGLGIDLEGIATRKNLQSGIAHALKHLRGSA
jgi:PAS domain S-box-containing protein